MRLALLLVLLAACGTAGHAPGAPIDAGPCVVEAATATCARAGAVCGSLDLIDNCGATVRVNCDCPGPASGFAYSCVSGSCQQIADCRDAGSVDVAADMAYCQSKNRLCSSLIAPEDGGSGPCGPRVINCGDCPASGMCVAGSWGSWCCPDGGGICAPPDLDGG